MLCRPTDQLTDLPTYLHAVPRIVPARLQMLRECQSSLLPSYHVFLRGYCLHLYRLFIAQLQSAAFIKCIIQMVLQEMCSMLSEKLNIVLLHFQWSIPGILKIRAVKLLNQNELEVIFINAESGVLLCIWLSKFS